MEQKNLVTLEHKIEDRVYQLVLAPDAPLAEVYSAVYAMMSHVLSIIKAHHDKMAVEEKKEDGEVPPN